jgi:hypothetical protein
MTRTTTALAVAADYADAMMVARRAKNWLFLLLLLTLLVQVGIFCVVRFVPGAHLTASVSTGAPGTAATTQSTEITAVERTATVPGIAGEQRRLSPFLQELVSITDFLGVTLTIVLPIVLLLIVTIMLVGRLVGVTHVTSAFCWAVLLLVILFPWQSLLNSHGAWVRFTRDVKGHRIGDVVEVDAAAANAFLAADVAEPSEGLPTPDVRFPGVLYTWPELQRDFNFPNAPLPLAVMKWARFIGWPVIAIIMLLSIQARSSRGLKFALGESDVQVEVAAPPA